MPTAIAFVVIFIITFFLRKVARRYHISSVIILIFMGIVMGSSPLKHIFVTPHSEFIRIMGDIALLCLMFIAGLESSWRLMYREARNAMTIAFFAFAIPFLVGYLVFVGMGYSVLTSLLVGISMGVTAEATKAQVLMELKKLKTRVGAAMMGAGVLDDILGLTLFVIITNLHHASSSEDNILLISAIATYFIGISAQHSFGRDSTLIRHVEVILGVTIIPFFFIAMGELFDVQTIMHNMELTMVLIVVATVTKMSGVFITHAFDQFTWKQLHIIGWGMNSRGSIELALAVIALRADLIPSSLYSGIILMTFITTLAFPFIVTRIIHSNPHIMD